MLILMKLQTNSQVFFKNLCEHGYAGILNNVTPSPQSTLVFVILMNIRYFDARLVGNYVTWNVAKRRDLVIRLQNIDTIQLRNY